MSVVYQSMLRCRSITLAFDPGQAYAILIPSDRVIEIYRMTCCTKHLPETSRSVNSYSYLRCHIILHHSRNYAVMFKGLHFTRSLPLTPEEFTEFIRDPH